MRSFFSTFEVKRYNIFNPIFFQRTEISEYISNMTKNIRQLEDDEEESLFTPMLNVLLSSVYCSYLQDIYAY